MKGERLARWIAGALAVLAVAATLDTVLSAPRHRERLARKEADLRRIEAYANRWAREDALRADLERRQAWTPANLDELAVRALGVGAAKISPRPATPAAGGWHQRPGHGAGLSCEGIGAGGGCGGGTRAPSTTR